MDSSCFTELCTIPPLCSGGRERPKDQSKVNADCVCFNLSILRFKKRSEQQSNLFLRRWPSVVFPPPLPSLPLSLYVSDISDESLTHFTRHSVFGKMERRFFLERTQSSHARCKISSVNFFICRNMQLYYRQCLVFGLITEVSFKLWIHILFSPKD